MLPMPSRGRGLDKPEPHLMRWMSMIHPHPWPTSTRIQQARHNGRNMDMPRMGTTFHDVDSLAHNNFAPYNSCPHHTKQVSPFHPETLRRQAGTLKFTYNTHNPNKPRKYSPSKTHYIAAGRPPPPPKKKKK